MEFRKCQQNGTNGVTANHGHPQSNIVPREKLPLLEITDDMPHWLKFRRVVENEKRKKMNKEIDQQKEKEQNKYKGVPSWKIPVLIQKEEQRLRQLQAEEEVKKEEMTLRAEWDALPPWKQQILLKKGCNPLTKRRASATIAVPLASGSTSTSSTSSLNGSAEEEIENKETTEDLDTQFADDASENGYSESSVAESELISEGMDTQSARMDNDEISNE
ncbi:uncharacterized protein LOC116608909 isoform X1 [Nematostella vectensis]|uniref:uncharacterized protein LOC116608909 isoform X1 n=2 Tax=Nematostella vectensis TaxID=45351 RepID=UPI0020778BDF|nr:uncharacterized protein LOC116608909 isoform X1 [Nematostella vectensis]